MENIRFNYSASMNICIWLYRRCTRAMPKMAGRIAGPACGTAVHMVTARHGIGSQAHAATDACVGKRRHHARRVCGAGCRLGRGRCIGEHPREGVERVPLHHDTLGSACCSSVQCSSKQLGCVAHHHTFRSCRHHLHPRRMRCLLAGQQRKQ